MVGDRRTCQASLDMADANSTTGPEVTQRDAMVHVVFAAALGRELLRNYAEDSNRIAL